MQWRRGAKKEIVPGNRSRILIGSVGYLLDRYGYDMLPLVMRMLERKAVPPHAQRGTYR